jgi:hypothetical protein
MRTERYTFEETGEEREVEPGESYLDSSGYVQTWCYVWSSTAKYRILYRLEVTNGNRND